MNLEDLKWSILVTKSTTWFHLHEVPRIVKYVEIESRMEILLRTGGQGSLRYNGYRDSVWDDEKNSGDGYW